MMWIILGIVVVLIIFFVSVYNQFVKERNYVDEAFSTMDVYLKKRYDLIPNLVETVKGYTAHERETFKEVVEARNRYMSASSIEEKINNENQITGALSKLFALSEAYPELKANENFMSLQKELTKIEEDIVQARKYYNGTVRIYNTKCETFPSIIVARIMNFQKYPFFKVGSEEERRNVKVHF
jgi:LemA protein